MGEFPLPQAAHDVSVLGGQEGVGLDQAQEIQEFGFFEASAEGQFDHAVLVKHVGQALEQVFVFENGLTFEEKGRFADLEIELPSGFQDAGELGPEVPAEGGHGGMIGRKNLEHADGVGERQGDVLHRLDGGGGVRSGLRVHDPSERVAQARAIRTSFS